MSSKSQQVREREKKCSSCFSLSYVRGKKCLSALVFTQFINLSCGQEECEMAMLAYQCSLHPAPKSIAQELWAARLKIKDHTAHLKGTGEERNLSEESPSCLFSSNVYFRDSNFIRFFIGKLLRRGKSNFYDIYTCLDGEGMCVNDALSLFRRLRGVFWARDETYKQSIRCVWISSLLSLLITTHKSMPIWLRQLS